MTAGFLDTHLIMPSITDLTATKYFVTQPLPICRVTEVEIKTGHILACRMVPTLKVLQPSVKCCGRRRVFPVSTLPHGRYQGGSPPLISDDYIAWHPCTTSLTLLISSSRSFAQIDTAASGERVQRSVAALLVMPFAQQLPPAPCCTFGKAEAKGGGSRKDGQAQTCVPQKPSSPVYQAIWALYAILKLLHYHTLFSVPFAFITLGNLQTKTSTSVACFNLSSLLSFTGDEGKVVCPISWLLQVWSDDDQPEAEQCKNSLGSVVWGSLLVCKQWGRGCTEDKHYKDNSQEGDHRGNQCRNT